jgi:ketosteroid isomerase-like protein
MILHRITGPMHNKKVRAPMNELRNICVSVLCLILLSTTARAELCEGFGDDAAIERIRAQREAFNQAIAKKDIEAIGSVLHENVILITGTNSEVFEGREAQLALWQNDFDGAQRAVYLRKSHCLRVSPIVPIAMEYGAWHGVRDNDSGAFAAGRYAAKWRRVGEAWRLESEIFATESCGGAFCPKSTGVEQ